MINFRQFRIAGLFAALSLFVVRAMADEPALPSTLDEREIKTLLAKAFSSREEAQTGVCRIMAESQGDTKQRGYYGNKLEVFYAFERKEGLLRCDKTFEGQFIQYARSKQNQLIHVAGSNVVNREPRHQEITIYAAKPFDIRLFSITSWYGIENHGNFKKLEAFFSKCKITDAKREKDGLFYIELEHAIVPIGLARYKYWLDDTDGVRVMRYEDYASVDGKDVSKAFQASVATRWKKIDKVWVPIVIECQNRTEPLWKVSLEWESINKPVDQKHFSVEGFNLKPGTLIVDRVLPAKAL